MFKTPEQIWMTLTTNWWDFLITVVAFQFLKGS